MSGRRECVRTSGRPFVSPSRCRDVVVAEVGRARRCSGVATKDEVLKALRARDPTGARKFPAPPVVASPLKKRPPAPVQRSPADERARGTEPTAANEGEGPGDADANLCAARALFDGLAPPSRAGAT